MTENLNQNLPPELSEQDAELLSAYIDNMLTDAEREALEARLADEAFLRTELQAMRQTVAWLNQMPTLKAPRSFAVPEDIATENPPNVVRPSSNFWITAGATAAAIIFFVICGMAVLGPSIGNVFSNTINGLQAGGGSNQTFSSEPQVASRPTATPLPPANTDAAANIAAPTINTDQSALADADAQEVEEAEAPESDVARTNDALAIEEASDDAADTFAQDGAVDDGAGAEAAMEAAAEAETNVETAGAAATAAIQSQAIVETQANIVMTQTSVMEQQSAPDVGTTNTQGVQARQPTITATPSPVPSQASMPTATVTAQAAALQVTREMQATARPPMAVTGTAQAAPTNIESFAPTATQSVSLSNIQTTATALVEILITPSPIAEAGDVATGGSIAQDEASDDAAPAPEAQVSGQDIPEEQDGDDLIPSITLPDEATVVKRMQAAILYIILRLIEFLGMMP